MRKSWEGSAGHGAPNTLLLLRTMNQLWGRKKRGGRKKKEREEGRKKKERQLDSVT